MEIGRGVREWKEIEGNSGAAMCVSVGGAALCTLWMSRECLKPALPPPSGGHLHFPLGLPSGVNCSFNSGIVLESSFLLKNQLYFSLSPIPLPLTLCKVLFLFLFHVAGHKEGKTAKSMDSYVLNSYLITCF